MASSTRDSEPQDAEIHLWREDDWWVAKDIETGVTTQGENRADALANLDEAVALHKGEAGEPIEDEDAFLRDLGIDPEETTSKDLPEFMQ